MTVEELQAAWDDLQAWRADQLALRGATPSGQPVTLAEYLAATQAMIATGGQPGRAQQAAVRAWLQAGADLTEADRARWAAAVGARIAAREGRAC